LADRGDVVPGGFEEPVRLYEVSWQAGPLSTKEVDQHGVGICEWLQLHFETWASTDRGERLLALERWLKV
jgi:hypothetical protein